MPLLLFIGEALALVGITEAAGVAFTALRKVLATSAKKAMAAGLAEEAAVAKAIELHAADLAVVRKVMAGEKAQKASAAARIKDRIAGKDPTAKPSVAKPVPAEKAAPAPATPAAVEGEVIESSAAAATSNKAATAKEIAAALKAAEGPPMSKLKKLALGTGGLAGSAIIFDLMGSLMHPQQSGLIGGGEAAESPDKEALAQLQAMMARNGGLGGMGNGGGYTGFEPGGELREQYNKSKGAVSVLNTREGTRAGPPMNSVGVGLDVLTQGYEDMLDRIAHKEPLTLTEAYARHGIVLPNQRMS